MTMPPMRLMDLDVEGYEKYVLNLDSISTISLGVFQNDHGKFQACVITLVGGMKLMLPPEKYAEILAAMRKTDERDLDVPDAFLKGWDDTKGDDDDKSLDTA